MSASSASAIPYIGSKISLVTNSELRYEGILININTANSTVTLRDVRMSGTENRKAPHYVMPSSEVFDYIIFNGKDIKDLTVSEPGFSVKEDPAVVAVNVAPSHAGFIGGGDQHHAAAGLFNMHGGRGSAGAPGGTVGGPQPVSMTAIDSYAFRGNMPHGNYSPMNRGLMGAGNRNDGGLYGRPEYGYGGGRMDGNQQFRSGYRGGRGGAGGGGSGKIVGELTAQPNSSLKTQVASAFDFEQANSKFEKEKIEKENIKSSGTVPYNKNQSFFDNISCETLNRQHGRDSKVDRERQRVLDTETFGPTAALSRGPKYYRRGPRRVGGMRGGRGAYGAGGMYRQGPGGTGGPNAFGNYSNFGGQLAPQQPSSYNMPHIHAQ